MEEFSSKYERVVPFTSKTGVFGYNTWLYLYFNDLFPVAVSPYPYAVHNGSFPGSIATMGHDIAHKWTKPIYTEKYINSLADIYRMMFTMGLEEGVLEGYIIFLFEYLHERHHKIDCKNIKVEYSSADYSIPQVMIKTSFFTPERYGINTYDVEQWINHQNYGPGASYVMNTGRYNNEMFKDIYVNFCEQFKEFIVL